MKKIAWMKSASDSGVRYSRLHLVESGKSKTLCSLIVPYGKDEIENGTNNGHRVHSGDCKNCKKIAEQRGLT